MPEAPPTQPDVASAPTALPQQLLALFRRSPPLWIVPAFALLLVAALFPSSWHTELRPGFSHARAFVPGKVAFGWTALGALVYWGILLGDRYGLTGGSASLRFPDGVGDFDSKIVLLACLAFALLLTYGAPIWLLFR